MALDLILLIGCSCAVFYGGWAGVRELYVRWRARRMRQARGSHLDALGVAMGVPRRRLWWDLETDEAYRERIKDRMRGG